MLSKHDAQLLCLARSPLRVNLGDSALKIDKDELWIMMSRCRRASWRDACAKCNRRRHGSAHRHTAARRMACRRTGTSTRKVVVASRRGTSRHARCLPAARSLGRNGASVERLQRGQRCQHSFTIATFLLQWISKKSQHFEKLERLQFVQNIRQAAQLIVMQVQAHQAPVRAQAARDFNQAIVVDGQGGQTLETLNVPQSHKRVVAEIKLAQVAKPLEPVELVDAS